jgi:dienelactone hydrolase
MGSVHTEEIRYCVEDVEMRGHLAVDKAQTGPRPVVLVVHEWWGRGDYATGRAEQLAGLGYAGFAIDLYGDGRVAANPDEAGAAMNALIEDMSVTRARFRAALEAVSGHAAVDGSRAAAIGFCFGGGVVVHMARSGAPLRAVASFHGSLGLAVTEGPDNIDCRVAAYNGEQDVLVPAEDIAAFEAEMEKVNAHHYLVQLPGALHGFSNPVASTNGEKYGLPLAYDPVADTTAWGHMTLLFKDVLEA